MAFISFPEGKSIVVLNTDHIAWAILSEDGKVFVKTTTATGHNTPPRAFNVPESHSERFLRELGFDERGDKQKVEVGAV